ncbi:hypothetical protein [Thermomonospora cellulosilytica]|uniref:Uncharacterized protein n=1 Tax=Thermomonospora cellulosilytica TaxID=1411118 RepID=A0A7W3R5I6_9ACTN|nr:hypothetical protein [Thermomonospora cellulosilytica]MBA9001153.1 hypothetical protein [Thermomonospora cellulosilytica]
MEEWRGYERTRGDAVECREIRSFRGEVTTLTPHDLTPDTAAEADRFLLGGTPIGP